MSRMMTREADEKINWFSSLPFLLFHLIPLFAVFTGVTSTALVIFAVLYIVRMFAVTAGYHRYFSHRSYRASRPMQFVLAFIGTTATQKGPLWWAAHHRAHHRYSDTDLDIHSPQKGFWWSHVGWILCDKYGATDLAAVPDLAVFPELRFLNRYDAIGPWSVGIAAFLIGGWSGLIVGFFGSTVVLWHATFTINSLSHTFGTRRYATTDTSRNNPFLALLTFGEGWHNNHHHYQASARQGFRWWEIDVSWYALRALAAVRLVRDLRQPPADAIGRSRLRDGVFDLGMFRAAWRQMHTVTQPRRQTASASATSPSMVSRATVTSRDTTLHAKRIALEELVAASLVAAEELTRAATLAARTQTA